MTRYKYFFTKCSRIVKYHHRRQQYHCKSLFYAEWQNVYLYLIKLTQQKDANLILTRKCFTIAIKTIQLSSHIIKHDEFIKATFSSEQFLETNNIFAIRGKKPFLFHYVREEKKPNRVKYAQYYNKPNFRIKPFFPRRTRRSMSVHWVA